MTLSRHIRHLFVAVCILAIIWSCSGTPAGIIPPHEMAELLADIHEGEGVVEIERDSYPTDSTRQLLLESIYLKHGVTAEQVDSSMMWYGIHIEKYMEVYDETIKILEKRLAEANTMSATTTGQEYNQTFALEGDSVDLWTGARHRRFYALSGSDFITRTLHRDSKWEPGDIYTLRFKAINPRQAVWVSMMCAYDDGTNDVIARQLPGHGWKEIELRQDRDKKAHSVFVTIGYSPASDESMYIDSLSLVRQHPKVTLPSRELPRPDTSSPRP